MSLLSQRFTPRALRNFLGDRLNQLVARGFAGIFAYCLSCPGPPAMPHRGARRSTGFVPALSATLAITLGIATLGLLLVFIHHMSRSIQVSTIASSVGRSALEAAENL